MKKLYSLLTALLIIYSVQAQELVPISAQTAGGNENDHGAGVAVDHKGGVYVVGNFKSASITLGSTTLTNQGGWDAFLAKYDTSGALIWVRHYGNPGKDTASKVLVSPNGSIYVVAGRDSSYFYSSGEPAVSNVTRVLKYNSSGDLIWDRRDIGTSNLNTDLHGNLYSFGGGTGLSFSKYSPDGELRFVRSITSYVDDVVKPVLSVDRLGQVHLMFHTTIISPTNLTTIPANNLGISVRLVSRVWYDSLGALLGGESLTSIRERYIYYKARSTNEFVFTYTYSVNLGIFYYGWQSRGFGGFGERNTSCELQYVPTCKSADFDSDAAYFGETHTSPVTGCTNILPQSTGADMVFIRTRALPNFQSSNFVYSTNANGNTDERDVTIAVDTAGKYLFAVGNWYKRADTSHFRFAGSDLVNGGATGTSDILFLKFKITDAPLKAKAGTDKTICPEISTTLDGSAGGGKAPYTYSWSTAYGLSDSTVATPQASPDTTTTYILTVTDALGSIDRDTVIIKVNPNLFRPTISVTSGTNPFCEGNSVTLSALGGTNYVWSNGETSFATVVRKSDTITVTGTGPQGCVGTSQPYIVVMNPAPATPGISPATGYILDVCQGSTTTLTATHPDPTARFTWSTGATTPSINVTPGVYTVRARVDGNSCVSGVRDVKVQANAPATATLAAGGNTTFCEGDSVKLTVSTAAANTILWSNGATTPSIWVKTSGSYSALVYSPGCTAISTHSIAVTVKPKPAKPTISASGSTTFCAGGSVTLTASTNISGVSWLWSNGATTQSITVNASGTYSVTATADGCSSTSAGTAVTVNPAPIGSISASGTTTFCEGGTVQLTVSTTSGNTVLWSNGATSTSIIANTSGTYSAQITTPAGCTITTNSITVTVKPKPATPTISANGSTTFCAGGNVTLTASSSTSGATWRWNTGATTPSITVNSSGTYSVAAFSDGCISATAATTVVTVNPVPTGSISASGSTTFCEGDNVQLNVSTASGNTVLWSNGATTPYITVNTSGTYSAQITSPGGCTITTNSISVTAKPKPVTPAISASGSTSFCAGGNVTLTASTSTGGVTWLWSNGATTPSITVNASGTYTATASLDGCNSTSAGTTVTVNPAPTGSISASGNTTFCEGGNVQLNVNTASGNTVLWSNGATTPSITVNASGTYSAQITSPSGCTISTNSITVTVNSKPATPTVSASGSTTFCSGGSVTLNASSSTSGVSWQWSNGATTSSITVNASGTYTATASLNGCSSTSANTTVTVSPAPTGSISASGNTSFCEGGSVQLTVNTAPGNSTLWSNGATTPSITVNTSGTYSAQVTSPAGCAINTNSISTSVLQKPSPVIGQSGNELSVSPAASAYQWYLNGSAISGATAQSLTISQGGDYSVVVTGSNGCTATAYHSAVFRVNTSFIDYQAYPNPVTADLRLTYTLKEGGQVTFTIVDDQGRQKMIIPVGQQGPGDHQYTIRNAALRLGTGFYLLKISVGDKQVVHRIVVL